jgi:hypothetical protein
MIVNALKNNIVTNMARSSHNGKAVDSHKITLLIKEKQSGKIKN